MEDCRQTTSADFNISGGEKGIGGQIIIHQLSALVTIRERIKEMLLVKPHHPGERSGYEPSWPFKVSSKTETGNHMWGSKGTLWIRTRK